MMACNTIEQYLRFSWVGERLFVSDKVAIAYDKERKGCEIAYLTNRTNVEGGRVRCAPFKDMDEIDKAFEVAKLDGALHVDEIAAAIEKLFDDPEDLRSEMIHLGI